MSEGTRIAVLMTCFNRRDLTLRCLRGLLQQSTPNAQLSVVLVDDGSSDGTTDAVQGEFPLVEVVPGTGQLYWSRGMALAWRVAASDDPDYYLLLNDDVDLLPGAVERILAVAESSADRPTVTVGAMVDPDTGVTTYSGQRLTSLWNPMAFVTIEPDGSETCGIDLFSGNFVLVPRPVYRLVGTVDPAFRHGIGDFDYARRAAALGIDLVLAPGHFGRCALNPPIEHSLRTYFTSLKTSRLPRDWARYCWRHGHWWALPVSVPGPYVKALLRAMLKKSILTY